MSKRNIIGQCQTEYTKNPIYGFACLFLAGMLPSDIINGGHCMRGHKGGNVSQDYLAHQSCGIVVVRHSALKYVDQHVDIEDNLGQLG